MDFVEQHSKRWVRDWKQQAHSLGLRPTEDGTGLEPIPRGLADRWRDLRLADIDGGDVHALISEVKERGIPGTGKRNQRAELPTRAGHFRQLVQVSSLGAVEERRLKSDPGIGVAKPMKWITLHGMLLIMTFCDGDVDTLVINYLYTMASMSASGYATSGYATVKAIVKYVLVAVVVLVSVTLVYSIDNALGAPWRAVFNLIVIAVMARSYYYYKHRRSLQRSSKACTT